MTTLIPKVEAPTPEDIWSRAEKLVTEGANELLGAVLQRAESYMASSAPGPVTIQIQSYRSRSVVSAEEALIAAGWKIKRVPGAIEVSW